MEVLKNTPKTHVDYENLKSASEKMKDVADHLNRQITEIENRNKLIKLKEIFYLNNAGKGSGMNNIVEPHRKYVYEGELSIPSDTSVNKQQYQKHYFFLFSDMLVCCKEVPETIKKKIIEEKQKALQQNQQSAEKKKKGLRLFSRESNADTSDSNSGYAGAFDDDENEIPEHFYTITFTIKFNTEKFGVSTPSSSTSSPLIPNASTPSSPSVESPEEMWVRDFISFDTDTFNQPTLFQLITTKETYTFDCPDAKTREKWVNHINNTLDELKKKKKDSNKDRAKPKGFPIILTHNAALFVQAMTRGKLTRMKKGDVDKRFKPRSKTRIDTQTPSSVTSPVSPREEPIDTEIVIPPTIDHVETNFTKETPKDTDAATVENVTPHVAESVVPQASTSVEDETPVTEPVTTTEPVEVEPVETVTEPVVTEPETVTETTEPVVTEPVVIEPATKDVTENIPEPVIVVPEEKFIVTVTEEAPTPTTEHQTTEPETKKINSSPRNELNSSFTSTTSETSLTSPRTTPRTTPRMTPRESFSTTSTPREYAEEEDKSPLNNEEEEVFYDDEGNVLPPWKVELMKRFKKFGRFNNVIAQQPQETKKVEKKIDIPKKGLQLNAIRSMFEEKDKQAKEEMTTLRKAKEEKK